jgi:cytochrome bd-type quinol oxidase subunit 2
MSTTRRIVALIIMLAFIAVGIGFMIQRIGAVIGWDNAWKSWPIIVLLAALILLTAYFIYMTVKHKLNR